QENAGALKYMGRVAQDIFAIPLKHTLSDGWSSMTAETASMDIITKEWLKSGLAEGVNWTEFIKIHNK
ncbi:hypothetical protein B0H17DRAFT_941023, partial [Mycena rosella]